METDVWSTAGIQMRVLNVCKPPKLCETNYKGGSLITQHPCPSHQTRNSTIRRCRLSERQGKEKRQEKKRKLRERRKSREEQIVARSSEEEERGRKMGKGSEVREREDGKRGQGDSDSEGAEGRMARGGHFPETLSSQWQQLGDKTINSTITDVSPTWDQLLDLWGPAPAHSGWRRAASSGRLGGSAAPGCVFPSSLSKFSARSQRHRLETSRGKSPSS